MSNELRIEKGVPVPPGTNGKGYWIKLFRRMRVGDSVLVPGVHISALAGQQSYAAKSVGIKITRRTESGGVRCWRVA
jgi:hypothetical protein